MTYLWIAAGYLLISAALYAAMRFKCKRDPVFKAPRSRTLYYLISLTWGLPAVLTGAIAALFIRLRGHKPSKYGWEWVFALPGIDWGLSLGLFIIAPEGEEKLMAHEHGHGIQIIYLGVFMPAAVLIPSFVRFRYRKIRKKTGKPSKKPYDYVWFENSATASGLELAVRLKREEEMKNDPAVSERADYK
ncbi:MAG: hypothetical protein IKN50_06370 [Clostridia bacterium]|nr:hypothetical protein [Clostridia bacterium]